MVTQWNTSPNLESSKETLDLKIKRSFCWKVIHMPSMLVYIPARFNALSQKHPHSEVPTEQDVCPSGVSLLSCNNLLQIKLSWFYDSPYSWDSPCGISFILQRSWVHEKRESNSHKKMLKKIKFSCLTSSFSLKQFLWLFFIGKKKYYSEWVIQRKPYLTWKLWHSLEILSISFTPQALGIIQTENYMQEEYIILMTCQLNLKKV